jgi:uncharacterized protein DUF4129
MILPAAPPIIIDRASAASEARRELSKRVYHAADRPPLVRFIDWIDHRISHLLDRAANASPGGAVGLTIIVLVVVALLLLIWRRLGAPTLRRTERALFESREQTAAEHRRAADEFDAAGDYAQAVRERLRAIVRELEDRAVLEPRAARTADEAATETAAVVPALGGGMRGAVRIFDEIWYGGRAATATDSEAVRQVDDRVREPLALTR